jgi:hypothetical protein
VLAFQDQQPSHMRLFHALELRAARRTGTLLCASVAMEGQDVVMDVADPDVETGALEVMGHDGFVFLDKKDGVHYLTHTLTLEQIALPSGFSYELVFEEGFGAALGFSGDEENFVLVEDVFPRKLCKTAEGQHMVVETLPNKTSRIWNLTRTMQSYQEADLAIIAGDLLTEVKIDAYLVKWPRDQSRFFVGAQALYTLLGLTSFGGVPSKWSWSQIQSWTNMCARFQMHSPFIKSWEAQTAEAGLSAIDRVLPQTSLSGKAFILAVCVYATSSTRFGGLRDPLAKAKARTLAVALIKALSSIVIVHPFVITIDFHMLWENNWPRPFTHVDNLRFSVDENGMVDVRSWMAAMRDGKQNEAMIRWYDLISGRISDAGTVDLSELVLDTRKDEKTHTCFFAQLFLSLGLRFDMACLASCRGTVCTQWRASFRDRFDDSNPRRVDMENLQTINAAKQASVGFRDVTVLVDKAQVKGLNLQNHIFVLPNNVGWVGLPGVSLHICIVSVTK